MSWSDKFAVGGAAAIAIVAPAEVQAQKVDMEISRTVDNLITGGKNKLKDSEGNSFNPAETFKGKPYILVFGLNNCKFCDEISTNLGKIAEKAGDNMPPIVMLDVVPEKDNNEDGIKALKEKYSDKGMKNVTFVFPETKEQAQLLQNKKDGLDAARNPNKDESHGMRIAVVNNRGVCVAAPLCTNSDCVDKVLTALKGPGIKK